MPIPQDGLAQPQRNLAFASVVLTLFVAVLDATIANIALPQITRDFAIRPVDAVWVVNGYQLAVTIALLPMPAWGRFSAIAASISAGWRCSRWPR